MLIVHSVAHYEVLFEVHINPKAKSTDLLHLSRRTSSTVSEGTPHIA